MTAGTPPDRLTRLEAIVEALALGQQHLQQTMNDLAANQRALQEDMIRMTHSQQDFQVDMKASIDELVKLATEAIQADEQRQAQANADRAAWQAEIQRIWAYLQGRNGNSGN